MVAAAVLRRLVYSDHLVDLLGRAEAAATRVRGADPSARAALLSDARRRSARLSARLDASPLTDETADAEDGREAQGLAALPHQPLAAPRDAGSGWTRALRLEGMPAQDVAALEYVNLLTCFDAEAELAKEWFSQPTRTLVRLHGLLVRGLVEPGVVGRPRQTARSVHDGAQGWALYHAPEPAAVPDLLSDLAEWLDRGSAGKPAIVVAGVVHERLLEWQPFEAANGRLARAAARVVLRARGLDPQGLATFEEGLAADPLAYHGEVAATIRRCGDLTPWLERWSSSVVAALEKRAATLAPEAPEPPAPRALAALETVAAGEGLSLRDYRLATGVRAEVARADLRSMELAGLILAEPGTQGLRWRRP